MKKLSAYMLSMLCAGNCMAEVALPYGITPLNGEVRLLYRPGFEATCTAVNNADPTDTPLTSITSLNFDVNGQFTYSLTMDDGSVTLDVNADGAGIIPNKMKFINKESKSNDLIANIFRALPPGYGVIGKSLRQSSTVPTIDVCESLPGGSSNLFSTKNRKVVGTAVLHGRPSLIIISDFKATCTVNQMGQAAQFTFSGEGWESFDLQSGLNSNSDSRMTIKVENQPEVNMNVASSCVISDTTRSTAAPSVKSLEARLTELKGLVEKGLITQEQYEQKRADILKAL